ncbi:MAG: undecaprenyl/decaprenyl-phosphate alpha-N-acetylglucosaminyl 1-phosphate transferase, partial [Actinomycetota bacterium]|nr:undecaprenyl/decaprenyl-phosphate alpha-N-acetylglucosaminyl 1-phosphate transferase [Actinomycetota bacterium]
MSSLPLFAYPLLFLGALALSALLTPVALGFATRHGILDHPAPGKSHTKAVPYLGGAAIVA